MTRPPPRTPTATRVSTSPTTSSSPPAPAPASTAPTTKSSRAAPAPASTSPTTPTTSSSQPAPAPASTAPATKSSRAAPAPASTSPTTSDLVPPETAAPTSTSSVVTGLSRVVRAARILEILDRYVPAPAIPLDHEDPFQLLVAVILSAQCTDARVNLVTPSLFARAPDARAMAQLRATQIRPLIRTCGLAGNKAKAIAKLSRILVKDHRGQVPNDIAVLEELPGVGHKTASVVMAQAFGEPAFPVDTHIHRLAGRWQLSRARTVEEVERDLKQLFPRERWGTLHLQFIYFGRQYCTAKGHVPSACPICSWAMSKARAAREERQGLSKPLLRPKRPRRRRRASRA
jgi:endonuclease III